jgi:hypothetical protein
LWLGLGVAFSPVLLDLAEHLVAHPWTRSASIFPVLLALAIRSNGGGVATKRLVWICVVLGVVIELIAASGGVLRLGRVGLVVAAFGILCGAGSARPSVALLLVWCVPLPSALMRIASPQLETTWGAAAAALLPGVTLDPATSGPMLVANGQALRLTAPDAGLALGFGLAGLGWFAAVMVRREGARAVGRALGWGIAIMPVQVALLAIGGLALAAGCEASQIRGALDQSGWILIGVLGIVLAWKHGAVRVDGHAGAIRC